MYLYIHVFQIVFFLLIFFFFAIILRLSIHPINAYITSPLNAFDYNELTYFNYFYVWCLNMFIYTVLHIFDTCTCIFFCTYLFKCLYIIIVSKQHSYMHGAYIFLCMVSMVHNNYHVDIHPIVCHMPFSDNNYFTPFRQSCI